MIGLLIVAGAVVLSLSMPDFTTSAHPLVAARTDVPVPPEAQPEKWLEHMPLNMGAHWDTNFFITEGTGVDPLTGGPLKRPSGPSGPDDGMVIPFKAGWPFGRKTSDMVVNNLAPAPMPQWRGAYLGKMHPGTDTVTEPPRDKMFDGSAFVQRGFPGWRKSGARGPVDLS